MDRQNINGRSGDKLLTRRDALCLIGAASATLLIACRSGETSSNQSNPNSTPTLNSSPKSASATSVALVPNGPTSTPDKVNTATPENKNGIRYATQEEVEQMFRESGQDPAAFDPKEKKACVYLANGAQGIKFDLNEAKAENIKELPFLTAVKIKGFANPASGRMMTALATSQLGLFAGKNIIWAEVEPEGENSNNSEPVWVSSVIGGVTKGVAESDGALPVLARRGKINTNEAPDGCWNKPEVYSDGITRDRDWVSGPSQP